MARYIASRALLPVRWVVRCTLLLLQVGLLIWFGWAAFEIRMYPIKDYGHTIHEFDPWFNYRATEYLGQHGTAKFFKWYDYMSWYPIGRPVGTTIYPGMQLTAVAIWEGMKRTPPFSINVPIHVGNAMRSVTSFMERKGAMFVPPVPTTISFSIPFTLNEICCLIPPWFGTLASLWLGLLTYEVSRSVNASIAGVAIMSVLPAHLMRSIGGKFDNEAIAMAAICSTFYLWVRSVRTPSSWPVAVLAAVSYVYMVAAWGGYIFVLNLIGVHALILACLGRFNSGVHRAYTLFYMIGTAGAIQVPVVSWQPLRSLEQLGPLGVFFGYQVLAFCDASRRRHHMTTENFIKLRIVAFCCFIAGIVAVFVILWPTGFFGPFSSRIRGLFVKHTKTGNPLVDSVAEHKPASVGIYRNYLHVTLDYLILGVVVCLFKRNNAAYLLFVYGLIAAHFSGKMSRLVLICAPIASMTCGIWVGFCVDFLLSPFLLLLGQEASDAQTSLSNSSSVGNGDAKKGTAVQLKEVGLEEWEEEHRPGGMAELKCMVKQAIEEAICAEIPESLKEQFSFFVKSKNDLQFLLFRCGVTVALVWLFGQGWMARASSFVTHADAIARRMSDAKVMYMAPVENGATVLVDDYWQGYKWIEKNTPDDARVMAWWDYGYQITGIANRTSIADGNTWNHEHIATLGKILTSPQKNAYNAIRHLADYVLVWAGERGDDLGKSPHLARIGNSVFPDHCGDDDPRCTKFGFYDGNYNTPTPMMQQSLLYNLVKHKLVQGAEANPKYFQEVHRTKHGLLRIFKVINVSEESKAWVANPANRICDAPGSWYCVGQYPPALSKLIEKRRSFSQVEDFNRKGGEKSAYTRLIEKERSGRSEM